MPMALARATAVRELPPLPRTQTTTALTHTLARTHAHAIVLTRTRPTVLLLQLAHSLTRPSVHHSTRLFFTMFAKSVILATLATSASAFTPTTPSMAGISFPKLGGKRSKAAVVTIPAEEQPLTERLGGVGVTKPFPEGFGE